MLSELFIVQLFYKGGILMVPIMLCSIISLAIFIERFIFFKKIGSNVNEDLQLIKSALHEKNFTEALRICKCNPHPIFKVIKVGIDNLDLNKNELLDIMKQEALIQLKLFEKFMYTLSTISSIAPLLGLTGTVTGMINAFSVITKIGIGEPTALAGGISEALYTTAAGLFVGIPTLIIYNWCDYKSKEFSDMVEIYAQEIANNFSNIGVTYEKIAA